MATFEAQDPLYEARVRASFTKQAVMHTLGASLTALAPGVCEVTLPHRADLGQQNGFLHAGILTTVLDTACGYAAATLMPADAEVLSTEFHTHLLAPAAGERFIARAHVERAGRTLTVCRAEGYIVKDGAEKLVTLMTATMIRVSATGARA